MGGSINGDIPKSSILRGFFTITIHFGVPPFMEPPIYSIYVVYHSIIETNSRYQIHVYVYDNFV